MSFQFHGQRVLVTGASRGIGRAVAAGFARAGGEVIILADDERTPETAAALSAETGREVEAHVCDITERSAVRRVVGALGRLDVLVNNAGLERYTPMLEPGEGVERLWRRIVEINVIGTYYVTREALARMERGARVVITASVWGRTASEPGFSAYCTSKHANVGFTRALARELGPRGIRVNAVCPGWVRTEASLLSLERIAERDGRSEDECLSEIVRLQAIDGLMVPEDVVSAYLFLASEHAANVTGQLLEVDRGELMA